MSYINIIVLLSFTLLCGCASPTASPTIATGEAIARADVRRTSAQAHVREVIPRVINGDRVHLESADTDLSAQKNDLSEARKQLIQANALYAAEHDALTKVRSGMSYKIGRFLSTTFKWLLGIGLAGIALRAISLVVPGPVGMILSVVSTGIFGILSGGVSLIQSVFDNLWFRKYSKR